MFTGVCPEPYTFPAIFSIQASEACVRNQLLLLTAVLFTAGLVGCGTCLAFAMGAAPRPNSGNAGMLYILNDSGFVTTAP